MKILLQLNYVSGLGADRWIVTGYKDAFEELGHQCFFLTLQDDFAARLKEVQPDVLLLGIDQVNPGTASTLEAARRQGTKVCAFTDSLSVQKPDLVSVMKNRIAVDIYYGETEAEWMEELPKVTGKPYHVIANAANPKYHFPTKSVKKYECDIAFLGANLPLKKQAFERLLFPLQRKYKVKVFGPGWTVKDAALKTLAKIARTIHLTKVNDVINKARMSVPVEEENQLYSSAKVSLNIHEMRAGKTEKHVILNERTFKIPACGGLEICDPNPVLRRYFAEDEVLMSENDEDWYKKIDYYLHHETERKTIQEKGTARALKDHTYRNRVEQLLQLITLNPKP